MIQLIRILAAWALTLVIYTTIATTQFRQRGSPSGQLSEGMLGIGLVVGLPTLAFALLLVWPTDAMLRSVGQPWAFVFGAAALFGLAMLFLTAIIMPADWKGASAPLVAFAALLGLVWGLVSLLMTPASQVS